jgi:hypothetical protein
MGNAGSIYDGRPGIRTKFGGHLYRVQESCCFPGVFLIPLYTRCLFTDIVPLLRRFWLRLYTLACGLEL